MARDPLLTVLELRRREVDEARRALATTLALAAAANERANEADRTIEAEGQRAADPSGDDHLVEAFAAWLPHARHRAVQARALHDRHEADVARLRADLQACRTGLESVETLLAERDAREAGTKASRAQLELDDIASRTPASLG